MKAAEPSADPCDPNRSVQSVVKWDLRARPSGCGPNRLAIAGIPFGTWLRWIGWLMVWLVGTGAVFLALGTTVVRW